MKPVLLAQLSDLHLGANWDGVDPRPRAEEVIEAVRSLPNPVDAVVASGDLTDDGREESYAIVRELLGRFDVPVHVLPGNHDNRARLRQAFELPGAGEDPVDYVTDVGELRLVVLDSNVPGQDPGAFDPEQLAWLDTELGSERERPTLLVMHHSPLPTGIPEWDEINLVASEREALAAVIGRHPQVRAIAGGHLHRTAAGALAGRPVLSAPSTYFQGRPDFQPWDFANEEFVNAGPPGFALHVLRDGELSSQVELLGSAHGGSGSPVSDERNGMRNPFTHKKLDEVKNSAPEFGFGDDVMEARFAKDDFDAEDTGFSFHRIKPGKRQPFGHVHEEAEEVYVIVRGSGFFKLDDEIIEVESLDAVRVSPEVTRAFEAGDEGLEVIAFGPRRDGDGKIVPGWWSD